MIEFDSLGSPNSLNLNPSRLSFATHFPSSKNLTHKQPWVSISYYEKTVRCGDEFNGYNPSIHVDGLRSSFLHINRILYLLATY